MSAVNGLATALRLYQSDKIKERAQGLEQLKEIFSNRENLALCQETYAREGGSGWVAFFQCLFQVVIMEKKMVVKAGASAQADKRLADSISFVRRMTERTVTLISRKAFLAIFSHMTRLLVFSGQIFPPAALDYAKGLRCLLAYPPHLETLDHASWKIIMRICWAAVLGDEVRVDDEWEDGEELEAQDGMNLDDAPAITQSGPSFHKRGAGRVTISQINVELASLIPILLTSTLAPLLPVLQVDTGIQGERVGYSILLKIHRFLNIYQAETSAHLPILRSLSLVLAELELNCRDDYTTAGLKLLPQLVALWSTRNKALREQVIISLRMLLPFVTHKTLLEPKQSVEVRDTLEKLMDGLARETSMKGGIEPLEIHTVRLKGLGSQAKLGPFELRGVAAGFEFGHEQALCWAVLELYAEVAFYLFETPSLSAPATPSRNGPSAKRRRVENALGTLVATTETGSLKSRLLALQILIFLGEKHFNHIHAGAQADIRRTLTNLISEDDEMIQSWAFIGLSSLIQLTQQPGAHQERNPAGSLPSLSPEANGKHPGGGWNMVWTFALRKASTPNVCRAACHTASTILSAGIIDQAQASKDIRILLHNIDIQGPIYAYESVCCFLSSALDFTRSDVNLYSLEIENKVLSWLEKIVLLEGPRGHGRLEQNAPADVLRLLDSISRFESHPLCQLTTEELLPDAAIVDRLLEEAKTQPIRDFLLQAIFPSAIPARQTTSTSKTITNSTSDSLTYLEGRPRRLSSYLNAALRSEQARWEQSGTLALPAERLRRCIDLIVVVLAFQATVQVNGSMPDQDCVHSAIQLLEIVQASINTSAFAVPSQYLVWRGLEPLVNGSVVEEEDWTILIRPDVPSGVRQDLLPISAYDTASIDDIATEGSGILHPGNKSSDQSVSQALKVFSQIPGAMSQFPLTPISPLTQGDPATSTPRRTLIEYMWQLPAVAAAFRTTFELCRKLVETKDTADTSAQYAPNSGLLEDDDFGEIRNAETDLMPVSKEARECERTSALLLRSIIGFRLKGMMLAQGVQRPYKDPLLINCMLMSEGSRLISIGRAICYAVQNRWLRLGPDAIDLIEGALEDMLGSYAYNRDEGLLSLSLDFARASLPVWLPIEAKPSELSAKMMDVVAHIAAKVDRGAVGSWRVRLAVLRFIDDLLHYESAKSLWNDSMDEAVDPEVQERPLDPLAYLSAALQDVDNRVRIRAATSAAIVFYRPIVVSETHLDYYFAALRHQPGTPDHFDTFVVHTLWKLNCCIASAEQRTAVVFHLYEIPNTSSAYNQHLQSGLEAVASRLGLASISRLYFAHALVIVRSQLQEGQMAMRIPHRLYGFPTRKAYSAACLSKIGPAMLAAGEVEFIKSACDAAGTSMAAAVGQAFAATAAIIFASEFGQNESRSAQDRATLVIQALARIPSIDTVDHATQRVAEEIDAIAAYLWELLDNGSSAADMVNLLNRVENGGPAGATYAELMTNDASSRSQAAIEPASGAGGIISAYRYINKHYSSLSTGRVLFSAVLRLTSRINEAFLVIEQRRHLRALALAVVLHPDDFRHPTILQAYLRETLALLSQPDICGVVLSLVAWGFNQIEAQTSSIPNLIDLFVQLGVARDTLSTLGEIAKEVGIGLEEWIVKSSILWSKSDITRPAFEAALALWPEGLRRDINASYDPLPTDLVLLSANSSVKNAGELCKQYLRVVQSNTQSQAIQIFAQSVFWHVKGKLSTGEGDQSGLDAFLELLYRTQGEVYLPSLDSISSTPVHSMSSSKSNREPEAALRAAIVHEVAKLTTNSDHQTRITAHKVMQGMLPMISDIISGSLLPAYIIAQLSVLTPIDLSWAGQAEDAVLDGTINQVNWIQHSHSVTVWTRELVRALREVVIASDPFYRSLEPLLSSSTVTNQPLLPHLVQAALTCGAREHPEIALRRSQVLSEHFTAVIQWPSASIDTLRCILDVVLHLRHFNPTYRNGELGYNAWLEVDYTVLSEAAIKCGSYASALLFLELAMDQERPQPVDLANPSIQKIMYEIYSNVEDPDGFYGIENHDVRDALLRRLEHEGQSWRAFGWNGATVETSRSSGQTVLPALHNLHSFGFNQLASSIANKSRNQQPDGDKDPFMFELAWRTGDWDLPITTGAAKTPQGSLYSALRAVHRERNRNTALQVVDQSIRVEIDRLSGLSMERMAQIKATTNNLLSLREAARWLDNDTQAFLAASDPGPVAGPSVVFGNLDKAFSFVNAEKLTATRLSLLQSAVERESKNIFGDLLTPRIGLLHSLQTACHLQLGDMARENENLQAAINSITAIQGIDRHSRSSDEAQDLFSHVLWAQKEHALAIQHTADLITEVRKRQPNDAARLAALLGRMGHWTSLAKLKAAPEIKAIFDEACLLISKCQISDAEQARIFYEFARFADSHYAVLSRSSELERLRAYRDRKSHELSLMGPPAASNRRESSSRLSKVAQEVEEDTLAIAKLEAELLIHIKTALRMYGSALKISDAYDDSITQICSLWLQHDDNEDVNKNFAGPLSRIPTRKFVFLGPQLAARLYRPTVPTSFNTNLNSLMLRLSQDHPYHILYQIITLAFGVRPPVSAKRKSTDAENQGRGPAAVDILSSLASDTSHPTAQRASREMKAFVDASVHWSRFEERSGSSQSSTKPKAGSTHNLPVNCPLKGLRLDIPIATVPPPIDPTLNYSSVPTLNRYRSSYTIAGGVHRPKIMRCFDTNNKLHMQLFKADDEVRQDAVMEQVFTMTNDLLSRDRQSKARSLKFRTYNVVPLPEKTGIIEFVEGTKGIGEWLKPAHPRYRSGLDVTPQEIQGKISRIQDRDPNSPDLVKQYKSSMKHFQPVMRHFFVEKHKDPMAWFRMRLNYSRSVAVTSIVGWMVGLGDRHCSNILIDQVSGELVHIDFGIVFEDGRKLRIPEKVPFRLTNDIVNGLGLTGVEGTFRRCAEHTLRVLRDASSLVLTVLEVFKHDPLYAWAGDPDKLQRAQGGGRVDLVSHEATMQEKADRVLGKIRDKLGGDLSVEYTVNMLIQEARDVESLAKIYHGWAAWF
ncbi:hypothetical protein IAU60_006097 [Kwoniella sp. DSM 27419]